MRFSIKHFMAAVSYAALIAAALAAPREGFTLSLWFLSLAAVCFGAVLAAMSREAQRAHALGFAIASTMMIATIYAYPGRLPWANWFEPSAITKRFVSVEEYRQYLRLDQPVGTNANRATYFLNLEADYRQVQRIQSLNAVAVVAAGCIGAGVGALASRSHKSCQRIRRTGGECG